MILFALSIAPGIAISLYFFFKDEYNREPRKHVIISFFLGMVSALMAGLLETGILAITGDHGESSIMFTIIKAFLIVGFTEEWCKYVMVKKYAFHKPEFDEPFDGIVYAVMVSMGFATLENIMYVMQHGLATAIMRMFLSVPAHASFAVLMGYYLGMAKFKHIEKRSYLWRGVMAATFFHGCFDFFLFLQENKLTTEYVSGLLLFGGAIASYVIAVKLSRNAIRVHMKTSQSMHGRNSTSLTGASGES
jgi:RsiW-degrading membrane proteinase PrsW (M82 family)